MAYIGVSPSNGIRQKHTYTASAGQTSFSGAGAENISLSYKDSNYVDVYRNGVKLSEADYTSTSGTAIVLPSPGASENDMIEVVVYDVFSAADTVSKADGGQFDGNVTMAGTLGVTGETTLATHLNLGDNDKIKLGASGDLEIYHDGSNSIIKDSGTGNLQIQADDFKIMNVAGNENILFGAEDGTVRLFYNNASKFETTSSGVTVTGNITVTDGSISSGVTHTYNLFGATGTGGSASYVTYSFVGDPNTGMFSGTADTLKFATGGSERVRIDSSGNLLIGTTDTSGGTSTHVTEGIALSAGSFGGFIGASRSGDKVASFNRNSSDGTIVDFRKGGSNVGSIGNAGVRLFINSGTVGLNFAGDGSDQILPSNAGANRDAAIDLGTTNVRFKDLYLSGGVFLGGTGTANKLDDYEEGTWTPSLGGNASYHHQTGVYTKVGNKVFVRGQISVNLIGTGSQSVITGLPFTSETTTNGNPAGVLGVSYFANLNIAVTYISGYVESAQSRIQMSGTGSSAVTTVQYNTGNFFVNSSRLDFSMTYRV